MSSLEWPALVFVLCLCVRYSLYVYLSNISNFFSWKESHFGVSDFGHRFFPRFPFQRWHFWPVSFKKTSTEAHLNFLLPHPIAFKLIWSSTGTTNPVPIRQHIFWACPFFLNSIWALVDGCCVPYFLISAVVCMESDSAESSFCLHRSCGDDNAWAAQSALRPLRQQRCVWC